MLNGFVGSLNGRRFITCAYSKVLRTYLSLDVFYGFYVAFIMVPRIDPFNTRLAFHLPLAYYIIVYDLFFCRVSRMGT